MREPDQYHRRQRHHRPRQSRPTPAWRRHNTAKRPLAKSTATATNNKDIQLVRSFAVGGTICLLFDAQCLAKYIVVLATLFQQAFHSVVLNHCHQAS